MRTLWPIVSVVVLLSCAHAPAARSPAAPATADELAAAVRAERFQAVKACYRAGLSSAPALRGTIAIRFTLQPDGSIEELSAPRDSLGAPGVTACILEAFRGWRTSVRPAHPVVAEYPFAFAPEG